MKQPLVSFNTRKAMSNKTEIGKRMQIKQITCYGNYIEVINKLQFYVTFD